MIHDPIDILIEHNTWSMRQILERCAGLTEEQLHRTFEIGLGSVHDTVQHIVAADRWWTDRVGEREPRPFIEPATNRMTVPELKAFFEEADRDLRDVFGKATRENRLGDVLISRKPPGKRFTKAAAIVHTRTHAMYHRAQIVNMLRHLQPDKPALEMDATTWQIETEN